MESQTLHFKARVGQKLADQRLQQNLKKLSTKFVTGRAAAIAALDGFEQIRDAAVNRRNVALKTLDVWLERFEAEAQRRGTTVL
ncbi:MAG: (Fe-S)-binding protein, partial [Thiomonas sp.]